MKATKIWKNPAAPSSRSHYNTISNNPWQNTIVLRPQLVHRSIWNLLDIAGTILQLQSTMEFHPQLIHQHHLQSHLYCGNDPTVANHDGILSTAHARKTGETPFTMRNQSEHDPNMIRPHARDRLATVAPQR